MEKSYAELSVVEGERKNELNKIFNNELLNAIIGDKDHYILIWNENDNIEFVSSSFQELTDQDIKEWIGKKWTRIVDKEYQPIIINHITNSKDELPLLHIHLQTSEKEQYILNGSFFTLEFNKEVYFLLKIQNVSHKYMLEESIYNSHKFLMINKLSAGLVHEIKNPLASIKGFLQLTQKGIKQKNEYYKLMLCEIDKIESMTNELLENSKPANHYQFSKENVKSMIDDVAYLFSVQSTLNNVNLDVDVPQSLYVTCNRTKIKQVLINLIKNGIESMDKNGTLYITSYYENSNLIISIRDEGPGVEKSVLDNLNKPFYTTKTDGTGLGLMICNKIMKQHNGKLRISSNLSIGSNFELLLPRM